MTREVHVRGRGKTWKVWVPDPAGMTTNHIVYGEDGVAKGFIKAAGPSGKMIELHSVFETQAEAAYALVLGFAESEVKVMRTQTKVESLAKARAAREARREDEGA